ncbi:hypothetical protein [Paenibacillus sp.]|uniref:hypothetical protein n=1 Tax=Paenibacillus sp. TaxID=58172 RepID=UPI002D6FC684|nr:hypothetical protein [Paenibacillus sp.]HZG83815.1 hypothetical protein [Paenibacillus sp.]
MARTEVIPFREFVRGEWKPKTTVEIIVEHFDRNKIVYRVAGVTATLCLAGADLSFAADAVSAFAPTTQDAIDAKAEAIYRPLVGIGKWVIVFKGGLDTVTNMVQGDMISARKNFLGYLLVYVILLGLPWCLEQVEGIFEV